MQHNCICCYICYSASVPHQKMFATSHFLEILCVIRLTCSGMFVQALYKDTLAALQELLKSVLAKDPTPDGLQSVFKVRSSPVHLCATNICIISLLFSHCILLSYLWCGLRSGVHYCSVQHIESWLSSAQDHERERAVTATAHILAFYLDNLTVKVQTHTVDFSSDDVRVVPLDVQSFCVLIQNMVTFHNLGALLGRLSPRCSDPHPSVRAAAMDCIYTLLYIQLRYEGTSLLTVHFISEFPLCIRFIYCKYYLTLFMKVLH